MKFLNDLPRPVAALLYFFIALGIFSGGSLLLRSANPVGSQDYPQMQSYPGTYHRYQQGIGGGASIYGQDKKISCSQFRTPNESQAFFQRSGGPANDPYNLDPDGDGIACN